MGVAFVQETTIFREFGPVAGSTMRLSYDGAPPIGTMLSRQTTDGDLRHYMRIGASGLLALRMRGFKSWGSEPELMYFGGNGDLSGYDYLSFVGQKAFFGDAELRFPLIEAMKTPIGILGGVRGKFFFDIGGAGLNGQTFTPFTTKDEVYTPLLGYQYDINNNVLPIYGPPSTVSGFRLRDARASYGFGLETFAIGLPIHVDWAWKTLFNKSWEDLLFASTGGSAAFRKSKLTFWIGYDY
jgi:outer membrane protein assembly factor BamA